MIAALIFLPIALAFPPNPAQLQADLASFNSVSDCFALMDPSEDNAMMDAKIQCMQTCISSDTTGCMANGQSTAQAVHSQIKQIKDSNLAALQQALSGVQSCLSGVCNGNNNFNIQSLMAKGKSKSKSNSKSLGKCSKLAHMLLIPTPVKDCVKSCMEGQGFSQEMHGKGKAHLCLAKFCSSDSLDQCSSQMDAVHQIHESVHDQIEAIKDQNQSQMQQTCQCLASNFDSSRLTSLPNNVQQLITSGNICNVDDAVCAQLKSVAREMGPPPM